MSENTKYRCQGGFRILSDFRELSSCVVIVIHRILLIDYIERIFKVFFIKLFFCRNKLPKTEFALFIKEFYEKRIQ